MIKKITIIILVLAILGGGLLVPTHSSRASGSVVGAGLCTAGILLGVISGNDIWYCFDNFVIRPLLRKIVNALENRLLNNISVIITDKAGGGKDPHWITNWRNHILDSEARGTDVFRAVLADTQLCPYFGNELKQAFKAETYGGLIDDSGSLTSAPGTDPFQFTNNCTLSSDVNVDDFRKDFNNGGWDAWLQLIQPQNNYFGAFANALGEREKQVAIETKASEDQSIANKGFKGALLDSALGGTHASGCAKKAGGQLRCTFLGKTVTPGTIFDQGAELNLKQKAEELVNAQDMQDVILAIADGIISKIGGQLNNLLDGELYTERSYQENLDSVRRVSGAGTPLQEQQRLACENLCQTQDYPACSPAPSVEPQPLQELQCRNAAVARCLLACP